MYVGRQCRHLPDRWLCVWSWAVSSKTESKSSSAERSRRQSCTEEKNVEATSQMKEMSGSMLPASERLFVSDRVAWSFSKIFSMYTSPIRGTAQIKTDKKRWSYSLASVMQSHKKVLLQIMKKIFVGVSVFVLTVVVVLREDEADKGPTMVACRGRSTGRAASHLAQLLSQLKKSLTQNWTFQPITTALKSIRICTCLAEQRAVQQEHL